MMDLKSKKGYTQIQIANLKKQQKNGFQPAESKSPLSGFGT